MGRPKMKLLQSLIILIGVVAGSDAANQINSENAIAGRNQEPNMPVEILDGVDEKDVKKDDDDKEDEKDDGEKDDEKYDDEKDDEKDDGEKDDEKDDGKKDDGKDDDEKDEEKNDGDKVGESSTVVAGSSAILLATLFSI